MILLQGEEVLRIPLVACLAYVSSLSLKLGSTARLGSESRFRYHSSSFINGCFIRSRDIRDHFLQRSVTYTVHIMPGQVTFTLTCGDVTRNMVGDHL